MAILNEIDSCGLLTAIDEYPEFMWDWHELSSSPLLTHKFIENHFNGPWSWVALSSNPVVTPDFIRKYKGFPWVWSKIVNIGYGYEVVGITSNKSITLDFIEEYINKPWLFMRSAGLTMNKIITPEF